MDSSCFREMEESLAQSVAPSLLSIQRQGGDRSTDSSSLVSNSTIATAVEAELHEDLWGILPGELLERVFVLLPVTNIFRAGAVCKRWNSVIASTSFLQLCEEVACTRPWYFMCKDIFMCKDMLMCKDLGTSAGFAYDPVAKKWHNLELPRICTPNRLFSSHLAASVNGLLCFVDHSNGYDQLYTCNPMTKAIRKLTETSKESRIVSMTVNKATKVQTIVVARLDPTPDANCRWTLSIEIYDSSSKKWKTAAQTQLPPLTECDDSVICNGFFYCVTRRIDMVCGGCNGLVTYQLSSGVLKVASIGMPCSLTCVRLMNCNNKLVMVGRIDISGTFEGISIWELDTEWREVAKMPNEYLRGFGEDDHSFLSSGSGDLIYIRTIESRHLLLYDMSQRSWCWAQKCPTMKKHRVSFF